MCAGERNRVRALQFEGCLEWYECFLFFAGSVCPCLLMWCTHGWTAQTWLCWRNWRRSKSNWRRNNELWGSCGSTVCVDVVVQWILMVRVNISYNPWLYIDINLYFSAESVVLQYMVTECKHTQVLSVFHLNAVRISVQAWAVALSFSLWLACSDIVPEEEGIWEQRSE